MAALLLGQLPQLGQEGEEGRAVRLPALPSGGEAVVYRALSRSPQPGQPVGGEAEQRRAQRRQQGHVLPGIVQHLQQSDGHGDLRGAEELLPAVGAPGDPQLVQGGGVAAQHRSRRAQEDHDVLRPNGPVPDGQAAVQEPPDTSGRGPGGDQVFVRLLLLAVVGERGQVDAIELHAVPLIGGQVRTAGAQGLRLGVVQLAGGVGHHVAEDEVGPVQHLRAGAEVVRQQHLAPLAGDGLLGLGPALVFVQEDGGLGQPEAVDGLLHVPHHEKAAPGGQ